MTPYEVTRLDPVTRTELREIRESLAELQRSVALILSRLANLEQLWTQHATATFEEEFATTHPPGWEP